jgi:hypothetical protein
MISLALHRPLTGLLACCLATVAVVSTGGPSAATDPVLVGAGDIAVCGSSNTADEATADLLDVTPETVFTLGDNAYQDGSASDFDRCFDPSWGRHKSRIRPSAGNHDYHVVDAAAYFDYFGSAAGPAGKGYDSYDVGSWHIVVLNSNCDEVSCARGSAQEEWLRSDLAAHGSRCTMAMWHHPLFSSGTHGGDTAVRPFWDALYAAGADIVLNGHDHDYERFAPQDPSGREDASGIREFVVGTGGATLRGFDSVAANSAVRNATTHGVLKLDLRDGTYDWTFMPIAGKSFSDGGSGQCSGGSAPPPSAGRLANPSFERDADGDGRPDAWAGNKKFTRSSDIAAHEGDYVGRIRDTADGGTAVRQRVDATPGTSYQLSRWVGIPDTSDSFTFKVLLRWRRSDGSTIRSDVVTKYQADTQGEWTEAARSVTSPGGTASVEVRLAASNLNGTIYVDDCRLN